MALNLKNMKELIIFAFGLCLGYIVKPEKIIINRGLELELIKANNRIDSINKALTDAVIIYKQK